MCSEGGAGKVLLSLSSVFFCRGAQIIYLTLTQPALHQSHRLLLEMKSKVVEL